MWEEERERVAGSQSFSSPHSTHSICSTAGCLIPLSHKPVPPWEPLPQHTHTRSHTPTHNWHGHSCTNRHAMCNTHVYILFKLVCLPVCMSSIYLFIHPSICILVCLSTYIDSLSVYILGLFLYLSKQMCCLHMLSETSNFPLLKLHLRVFVAFKCFVVGKNRNHGGHPTHEFVLACFLGRSY